MVEGTASFVNILYRIMDEIRAFLLLLGVLVFGFGSAYFHIGRNQVEFDHVTPSYAESIFAGCTHVLNNAVGKINTTEYYSGGDASQEAFLWLLHWISICLFVLLFMNILLALICDIF